ncbi:DUF2273 domain-containing protein [Leucobacter rhizosphaerae]|uniref:DUF2273 domain-containing protein n=1 Tax=Leucobacter rhizosphaerae TaxID=2932245 RepID=A0ABY4FSY0_9MICO|nr:DUF2273 domain-containing protein [Leucobacter rhizosphaerae]UOQ59404.1 DUF2273 domain-containing protein [Leucobacter rhizosphaerae]
MSATLTGALIGAVLALTALIFGFWGFLLLALFMGIGAFLGRIAAGKVDVRGLASAFTGRRTS